MSFLQNQNIYGFGNYKENEHISTFKHGASDSLEISSFG